MARPLPYSMFITPSPLFLVCNLVLHGLLNAQLFNTHAYYICFISPMQQIMFFRCCVNNKQGSVRLQIIFHFMHLLFSLSHLALLSMKTHSCVTLFCLHEIWITIHLSVCLRGNSFVAFSLIASLTPYSHKQEVGHSFLIRPRGQNKKAHFMRLRGHTLGPKRQLTI